MLVPLTPGDTPRAVALWNRSAPHDPLTPALFDEKVWADPDIDPRRARLAVDAAGEAVGLGVGVRWGPPNETRGTIKLIGVVPERRRQGIGGQLLAAVEQALRDDGAATCRVAECSPNYLVSRRSARPSTWRLTSRRTRSGPTVRRCGTPPRTRHGWPPPA